MSRVLAGVRLSRTTDETTSPERQLAAVARWAKSGAHEVVGQAVDLDVSAYKVAPWQRPAIGHWMNDRTDEFDTIAWARLDRAVRRMHDMSRLAEWAKEHGKTLVFCSGPGGALVLDMASPLVSELIAMVLAFAAELEAQSIKERTTDSRAALRTLSRYAGGWTPFGYCPARNPDGNGYVLMPDPVYAPVLRRMAADATAGKSAACIVTWLTAEGIPPSEEIVRVRNGKPSKGGTWRRRAVLELLRSRRMTGVTEYQGEIARDAAGMPLRFAEPVVTDGEWRSLQEALDRSSRPRTATRLDSALLVGVASCTCGSPLYTMRSSQRGGRYFYCYYRCADKGTAPGGCRSQYFRTDVLDPIAERLFLAQVGHVEIEKRTKVRGDNHAEELTEVGQAMTNLFRERFVQAVMRPDYDTVMAGYQAEHARLSALPAEPDRIETELTGETFGARWAASDEAERRQLMIASGFRIAIRKLRDRPVEFATDLDPELADRARRAAEGLPVTVPDTEDLWAEALAPLR